MCAHLCCRMKILNLMVRQNPAIQNPSTHGRRVLSTASITEMDNLPSPKCLQRVEKAGTPNLVQHSPTKEQGRTNCSLATWSVFSLTYRLRLNTIGQEFKRHGPKENSNCSTSAQPTQSRVTMRRHNPTWLLFPNHQDLT